MKKLLSLLLAAVMLVSLIPPAALAGDTRKALKYVFGYEAYGTAATIPDRTTFAQDTAAEGSADYVADTVSLARFDTDKKWANVGSAPWHFDGMKYVYKMELRQGELWIQSLKSRTTATTHGFFIQIEVTEGGEYTPILEYQALANGYVNDVLLVPADDTRISKAVSGMTLWRDNASFEGQNVGGNYIRDITDAERESYRLGSVDMQETSPDENPEYKVFPTRTLEAKKYYLIFDTTGQTSDSAALGNKIELLLRSFTLEIPGKVDVPVLSKVNAVSNKESIQVSRTAQISVSMEYDNGDSFVEECKIEYESLNEHASVDENGVVTGVSAGNAKIKVTVTPDWGSAVSGEVSLEITPAPVIAGIEFSESSVALVADGGVNASVETELSKVMSDGMRESLTLPVTYASSAPEVATADENGVVTAHSAGEAVISATAETESGTYTAKLSVTVYREIPELTIDFSETVVKSSASETPDVTPGYKILTEECAPEQYQKLSAGDTGTTFFMACTYTAKSGNKVGWPKDTSKKALFAFSVDVPLAGYYSVSLLGGKYNRGAYFSIYTDESFLGDHSFWDGTQSGTDEIAMSTDSEKTLNTVYLKRGENKIYLRIRARGGGYPYAILGKMSFTPVVGEVALSHINAELPTELAAGETFSSDAVVYMTDGSVRHFGDKANDGSDEKKRVVSISASGDEVDISGFEYVMGDTGTRSYTITGASAGETEVKLAATLDGESFIEKTQKITVTNDMLTSSSVTMAANELLAGDSTTLSAHPVLGGDRVSYSPAIESVFASSDESVATVEGNVLKTHKAGSAVITVTSTFNGESVTSDGENSLAITVKQEGMTDFEATAGGSLHVRLTDTEADSAPLWVEAISNVGKKLDMTGATFTAKALTPEIAYLTGDEVSGYDIIPVSEGDARFEITVTHGGREVTKEVSLAVARGKTAPTYRTHEKAENARQNLKKYSWAKDEIENTISEADNFAENLDLIYDMIHSEGLARGYQIGSTNDPNAWICRYCNVDLRTKYGSYSMIHNAISRPWKTQCPDCKRLFPSNDFEKFYKLGLNEYGEFDRTRALVAHRELFGDKSVTEPGTPNSKQWKAYYGYGVKGGYLTNNLYPDLEGVKTINCGEGLREGETTATWGVDDGYGYVPSKDDGTPYLAYVDAENPENNEPEAHTYIAEYLHWGVWRNGAVGDAITQLSNAYYYTGDAKYGRACAILLDRIADFYPEYDTLQYNGVVWTSNGGGGATGMLGKCVGRIWETQIATAFITAYDTVFDFYDDEYVLDYIKEKQKTVKMRYAKNTPSQIRTHVEDGLIRGAYEGIKKFQIHGNFGMDQQVLVIAAVTLDSMPETAEILEFMMGGVESTASVGATQSGGGVRAKLMDDVDADGQGNEASRYNIFWIRRLYPVQQYLDGYDKYTEINLKENPKFIQMLYAQVYIMAGYYTPAIGDAQDGMLSKEHWISSADAQFAWTATGDPLFAQVLYHLNGNSAEGLHYALDHPEPESLEDEVQAVVDKYGTLDLKSKMMTNFGFGILRDGKDYSNGVGSTAKDTTRNVWMYFGSNNGHGHLDTMNIGMTAFGLNFMPDNAYPEQTGYQPNRWQWVENTLAHNTVSVNENQQSNVLEPRGDAKHFDGDGTVQVIDVSAPYVYKSAVSEYRRSLVYVHVDDENSYTVDFFRVLGGNTHLYSLHSSSNEIAKTEGLDFTLVEDENGRYISGSQLDENGNYKGTYAGRDATYIKNTVSGEVRKPVPGESLGENEVELPVEYGQDPNSPWVSKYETVYPRGYTWIKNVDRDTEPENKVEVDFKIKDFNKAVKDASGLHLHMTVLNESNVKKGADAEISIADALPPQKQENKNIDKLKYVLVKNQGEDLDTVFTTVFQPYRNKQYLKTSDELSMRIIGGTESDGDACRAVRIEHESGRVDYILYATNNTVTYEITLDDGSALSFRGFAGVYSVQNGVNTYRYLCDGDILGEAVAGAGAISGTVKTFTKTPEFKNEITITAQSALTDEEIRNLGGKYVFVDNGVEGRSGTYEICSASRGEEEKDIVLDIGGITTIRKFVDGNNPERGYVYLIEEGQSARIPLSADMDKDPVFDTALRNVTTSAGSTVSVAVKASSPDTENPGGITYEAETLPRGASLNPETGLITWKPDSSQVGENHFAVTAVDDFGRESTVHFYVTVYGSTTGSSGQGAADSSASENTGTTGGGGGGGTSGGGTTDTTPDGSAAEDTDTSDKTDNGDTPDASGETDDIRFTDLGNHAWAEESINSLASDGIVKGTTHNTYSPAANITRADFALLLVRAFNLTSDNTENFADVSTSDYFAPELAIARNTGIVNGIGDNKYAPRNTITRQDMMTIVYRALQTLGNEPPLPKGSGAERNVDAAMNDSPVDYQNRGVTEPGEKGTVEDGGGIQAPAGDTTSDDIKQEPSPVGEGGPLAVDEALLSERYGDWDTIAPYARDAVSYLIANGIVNGKSGRIAPTDYTTRAEVAVLIKRMIDCAAKSALR